MLEFKKITEQDEHLKVVVKWQKFQGQAPYLSITYDLNKYVTFSHRGEISGGSDPELIAREFPQLKGLIMYHCVSTEGPTHYIANALYAVSNRDCWGLLKGEKRQLKNGKTGLPVWQMIAIDKKTGEEVDLYRLDKSVDSETKPECSFEIDFRPWYRTGEGKEPDLEQARYAAKWSDAQLEDITEENLKNRLPELMKQFKKEVEKIGLEWPS